MGDATGITIVFIIGFSLLIAAIILRFVAAPFLDLKFVNGELAIGEQRLVNMLIVLQLCILAQKLKNLFDDLAYFVLELIKYPVVVTAMAHDTRIFQINHVSRSFGLREIEDFFQVGDTHFAVLKNKMKNAQSRFVGASLENL
jgi:hypothetical protein